MIIIIMRLYNNIKLLSKCQSYDTPFKHTNKDTLKSSNYNYNVIKMFLNEQSINVNWRMFKESWKNVSVSSLKILSSKTVLNTDNNNNKTIHKYKMSFNHIIVSLNVHRVAAGFVFLSIPHTKADKWPQTCWREISAFRGDACLCVRREIWLSLTTANLSGRHFKKLGI